MKLILSTLGEEQQALSRLCSMGGIGVREVGLLISHVSVEMLVLDRLVAEPEELLGKDQAPGQQTSC